MTSIAGSKVVLIIAPENFRDEELFETRAELEDAGAEVTLASTRVGKIKGMMGGSARTDVTIDQVDPANFDAVVFIGGSGATALFDDLDARGLAQGAVKGGKLVGAICVAPSILANAGLLKGRRATVFKGDRFLKLLNRGEADYTGEPVTVDGRLITADGPMSATEFGKTLVKALASR